MVVVVIRTTTRRWMQLIERALTNIITGLYMLILINFRLLRPCCQFLHIPFDLITTGGERRTRVSATLVRAPPVNIVYFSAHDDVLGVVILIIIYTFV